MEEVELGRSWEESSPATWPEVAGRRLGSAGSLGEEEEEEGNEKRKKEKEKKCKGKSIYRFWICKGVAIK